MIIDVRNIDNKEELEVVGDYIAATLETSEGLSKHKKFVLVDITNSNNPKIIAQNLTGSEKQECCELLEKMIFGETYVHLEENSIRIEKPEYTDFDH